MNTFIKTIPIVFFSFILSCNSNKKAIENSTVSSIKETSAKTMNQKKYTKGTIITGEENSECIYVIKLEDNTLFDPINLDDNYKVNGLKINFTFQRLRMKNRCTRAYPVLIDLIKKQE